MQRIEPGIELEALFVGRELRIVADVVGVAHEGVDGAERVALAPRQDEKGVVKIARRLARDVAADSVGGAKLQRGDAGRAGSGAALGEDGHATDQFTTQARRHGGEQIKNSPWCAGAFMV